MRFYHHQNKYYIRKKIVEMVIINRVSYTCQNLVTCVVVRYPVWQHTFVSPSAFSRRAVVSYWQKYVHEVLVNRLGGLSLPRRSVVRLTDRPDMTLDVYRGRKTTMQQQQQHMWSYNSYDTIFTFLMCLWKSPIETHWNVKLFTYQ